MTVSRPSLAVDCTFSVTEPTLPRPDTTVLGAGLAASATAILGNSICPPMMTVLPVTLSVLVSKPHEEETERR